MKESKLIVGAVAAIAVFVLSVPVTSLAADLEGRAEKVDFSDLDIDKETGARVLYRRLQTASKRVCGVETLHNVGAVRLLVEQKRCYANSLDAAVARLDNALLTEIHEG